MAQDLDFFPQKFIRYGSGLRIFFRNNLFAMAQDLDFFTQKFIRYGSGLRNFFPIFFYYGSGVRT